MDFLPLLPDHGPVSAMQTKLLSPGTFISHSAEPPKAQQAWRYVLQDLVRHLAAQAKSLSSTQESQGKTHGLSSQSYGNYFLWWAPKNPIPKQFTNLSQIQAALTSLSQNSEHLPCGTCLFLSQAEMPLTTHRDGTKGHKAALQPGTGQIPTPQSPPSHSPNWMTSSLPTAQTPTGMVSRTDVHWFTAGRLFGSATTRSIIIF